MSPTLLITTRLMAQCNRCCPKYDSRAHQNALYQWQLFDRSGNRGVRSGSKTWEAVAGWCKAG